LLEGREIRSLDLPTWRYVISRLRGAGILRAAPTAADAPSKFHSSGRLSTDLGRIYETITESPLPEVEWRAMRDVLGEALLERLLGVSRQSIVRYSSGERETPQAVAERLHVVALIVSDLSGSYNEYGVRRWFERPRPQLGGRSPSALMKGGWGPDDEAIGRVRALAAVLVGAGAV
jgi:hypothetical protein